MKKYTPAQLLSMLSGPVLTVLVGLILLFSPDTAAALVSRLLGWAALLAALADSFAAWSGRRKLTARVFLFALIGLWLLLKPLSLTKILGRVIGLALLIWGVNTLRRSSREKVTLGLLAAGAVALLGVVLFLLPMAATRLALNIAGIVVIGIGTAEGFDRLRGRKELDEGSDPNIIDVEKL